ncbi:helix-turn-helix domain-containing protein [Ruminococcaceae bacterium OttesenSCG-928-I18]|nr:helix-turn-helix domain-containing protein [Ruminococcaceae bacterium OttesenSCG-928-I18]
MTDVKALVGIMEQRGKSKRATAKALKINRTTLYRKLEGEGKSFTVGEVRELIDFLGLTRDEVYAIFLS